MSKFTFADLLYKDSNNLDLIRLICAFLVIWGHIPAFMVGVSNFDIFSKLFPFTYMGAIAVKCFFFISGLLVTNSLLTKANWKVYLSSRFFRIWPGLIFCTILTVVCCGFIATGVSFVEYFDSATSYIIKWFGMNFTGSLSGVSFMTDAAQKYASAVNGSLWTIPKEVTMYVLLLIVWAVVSYITKNKHLLGIVFLMFVLSPMFGVYIWNADEETKWLVSLFFSGALCALYKDKIVLDWWLPAGLFVCCLVLNNAWSITHLIAYLFVPVLFCYIARLSWFRKLRIKHDISYGIYLYGWPVQQFILFLFPGIGYYAYMFLSMLIATLFAYISFVWIEKPFMNIGKKVNRLLQ